MKILHLCPSHFASGGTEGIHHLISELNKCGADAKILYVGGDLRNPQPPKFKHYNCPYITAFPVGFDGVVIFPEIWADWAVDPKYKNCKVIVNWQGIDVYYWYTNPADRFKFLRIKDARHITMSEYGIDHLHSLGVTAITKLNDCINQEYLEQNIDGHVRGNTVLYNPVEIKLSDFQKQVFAKSDFEFKPLRGFTQDELINLFLTSKLYIDFGNFNGRERLPREAVGCGCCILTSKSGTAGYYLDNPIPDRYKLDDVDEAVRMIKYVTDNYEMCKHDFDAYRQQMKDDNKEYPQQVREFYKTL